MAKISNCPFCGKEIKTGFFSVESMPLQVTEYDYVKCCEQCYNNYKAVAEEEELRFGTKIDNYKLKTGKKLSNEELAGMFIKYLNEKAFQTQKTGHLTPEFNISCFVIDREGHFCTVERSLKSMDKDIGAEGIATTAKIQGLHDSVMFDKNDITKLEYRRQSSPTPLGTFSFEYAASYDIFLNDEREITYKPCIARIAVMVEASAFTAGKKLDHEVEQILKNFKRAIGSDLPVVKAEKHRKMIFKK